MNREGDQGETQGTERPSLTLTGGVILTEERLALLAPQWEATYRNLRRMDILDLGEREPATLFVWKGDQE